MVFCLCDLWNLIISYRGYWQITSELNTSNKSSLLEEVFDKINFSANLIGPPVFNFSFSTEHYMLILYFLFILLMKFRIKSSLYPIANIMSLTPIFTNASIYHSTISLPQNGTSGFGFLAVSGLSLVPIPPTNINAFIYNGKLKFKSNTIFRDSIGKKNFGKIEVGSKIWWIFDQFWQLF